VLEMGIAGAAGTGGYTGPDERADLPPALLAHEDAPAPRECSSASSSRANPGLTATHPPVPGDSMFAGPLQLCGCVGRMRRGRDQVAVAREAG
jgi:hypothetical protein